MPIEAVKRAGLFSETLFDTVMTVAAVITHLIDITTTRGIGLGGNKASVRKLTHASGIGHFYPLNSIDINA